MSPWPLQTRRLRRLPYIPAPCARNQGQCQRHRMTAGRVRVCTGSRCQRPVSGSLSSEAVCVRCQRRSAVKTERTPRQMSGDSSIPRNTVQALLLSAALRGLRCGLTQYTVRGRVPETKAQCQRHRMTADRVACVCPGRCGKAAPVQTDRTHNRTNQQATNSNAARTGVVPTLPAINIKRPRNGAVQARPPGGSSWEKKEDPLTRSGAPKKKRVAVAQPQVRAVGGGRARQRPANQKPGSVPTRAPSQADTPCSAETVLLRGLPFGRAR